MKIETRFLVVLASLCFTAVGCASLAVETTVHVDGSFTRDLKFTVGKPPMGGQADLSKTFVPLSKEKWKIASKMKDDNLIVEASRKFAKNSNSNGDVSLLQKIEKKQSFGPPPKNAKKEPPARVLLINEVSVKEIAPGKFEYREVLRWKGQRDAMEWAELEKDGELKKLRACLPESISSDANTKKLIAHMAGTLNRILFGPGTPMMPQFLMQTELAVRRMLIMLGNSIVDWLGKEFAGKLTEAQRVDCARKVLKETELQQKLEEKKADSQPKGPMAPKKKAAAKDETELVAMTFVLNFPGQVLETNGQVDRFSGTVYWGVYPQAAAYKDVVLRVVFTVK
jgi:hypothetical protein